MLEKRQSLKNRAEELGIEIKGLDNIPYIVQSRPMFDFTGVDSQILEEMGVDPNSVWEANGRMNTAIFPDGTVEDLYIASDQYQVVQHLDVLEKVLNTVPAGVIKGVQLVVSKNGGKMFAIFRTGHVVEIKPGDNLNYEFFVENSGDASRSLWFAGGVFRMLCSNGCRIPDKRVEQISSKKLHKGGLNLDEELKVFLDTMDASMESMNIWKKYTEKKLTAPQVEMVFETLEAGPRVQEDILDQELRGEDTSVKYLLEHKNLTAWDLFNSFTQRITDSDSFETVKAQRSEKVANVFDELVMTA